MTTAFQQTQIVVLTALILFFSFFCYTYSHLFLYKYIFFIIASNSSVVSIQVTLTNTLTNTTATNTPATNLVSKDAMLLPSSSGQVVLSSGLRFNIPMGPKATNRTNGSVNQPPKSKSSRSSHSSHSSSQSSQSSHQGSVGGELDLCTEYQLAALGRCLHAHSIGDFCIVGPKGVGKSFLSRAFSELLGYTRAHTTLICLYKDMTYRDLFEGRRTKENGDTYWELSSLLTLALEGGLAILDGVEQIHPATLASLQRLVVDREVILPSGKRFMSLKRCQGLLKRLYKQGKAEIQENNETDWCTPTIERLTWLKNTYGIYVIHPSFRIIALARPPLGLFKIQIF